MNRLKLSQLTSLQTRLNGRCRLLKQSSPKYWSPAAGNYAALLWRCSGVRSRFAILSRKCMWSLWECYAIMFLLLFYN